MAVTRDGIPVRVLCWPGNTSDSPLIRQVKDELRDWTLGRVIWAADRGFTSTQNRRHLAAGADGYILGEKLRSGSAEATAALSRQDRYQQVAENLRVKEVKVSDQERFVVCHNPDAADRDAATRARLIERLAAACARHAALGSASLVLYDVSTLYFETDTGDGFREPGYSKERRLEPQITVGLLTDAAGFPLMVEAFEGNRGETTTMLPTITAFMAAHQLAAVTVVADAGMISAGNQKAIEDAGLSFILGMRFPISPTAWRRGGASTRANHRPMG